MTAITRPAYPFVRCEDGTLINLALVVRINCRENETAAVAHFIDGSRHTIVKGVSGRAELEFELNDRGIHSR